MKGRKMGNDLSKRWIIITAAMLLTGCPIHQSADFASDFYKTDRMRICTKHSNNIDSGVMALSSPESYDTVILNKHPHPAVQTSLMKRTVLQHCRHQIQRKPI